MSRLAKLAGVATLAGVSAGLYLLMKKWDSDWCTVVIEVPAEVAGRVIGRKGANVKLIEAKSQTKIKFESNDDNPKSDKRKCVIQGPLDCVGFAQSLLQASIQSALCGPAVRHITIPASVAGGIVGTRGQNIKDLMQKTGVHIKLDAKSGNPAQTTRDVTITGSKEGVAACVAAIQEKVDYLLSRAKNASNRPAVKYSLQNGSSPNCATEELHFSPSEVLVCAVASPVTLYLQYTGRSSAELGEMIETMLKFYGDALSESMCPACVSAGDMVAARGFDGFWYRARVVHVRQSRAPRDSLESSRGLPGNLSRTSGDEISECADEVQKMNEQDKNSVIGLQANGTPLTVEPEVLSEIPTSVENDLKLRSVGAETTEEKCTEQDVHNRPADLRTSQDLNGSFSANNSDSNSNSVVSTVCLVFLVDFGDYHSVTLHDLRELRTDFLRLSHQAFKVQLASVQPQPKKRMAAEFELSLLSRKTSPGEVTAKVVGYLHKNPVANGNILSHANGAIPSKHLSNKAPFGKKDADIQLRDTLAELKALLQKQEHLKPVLDTDDIMSYVESNGSEHLRQTGEKISQLEAELFCFNSLARNNKILPSSCDVSNNNNDCPLEEEQRDLKHETIILKLLWKEISEHKTADWQNLSQMNWSEICSLLEDKHGLDCEAHLTASEGERLASDIASRETSLRDLQWFDYLLRSAERLAFETSATCERQPEPVPLVRLCCTTHQQQVVDVADDLVKRGLLRAC